MVSLPPSPPGYSWTGRNTVGGRHRPLQKGAAGWHGGLLRHRPAVPLFGQGKTQAAAEAHGLKLLARMPIDPKLAELADAGRIEDFQGQWLASVADVLEKFEN